MSQSLASTLARGAAAGVGAAVIQAAIGKTEEKLLLPPWEDADIAPRLMERLGEMAGVEIDDATKWVLGTVFHFGYGAAWGMLYAAATEKRRVNPLLGGLALGGLIYAITFPRWGGAVQTGTERPPEARTREMELVAASVTSGFGVSTALLDQALRKVLR